MANINTDTPVKQRYAYESMDANYERLILTRAKRDLAKVGYHGRDKLIEMDENGRISDKERILNYIDKIPKDRLTRSIMEFRKYLLPTPPMPKPDKTMSVDDPKNSHKYIKQIHQEEYVATIKIVFPDGNYYMVTPLDSDTVDYPLQMLESSVCPQIPEKFCCMDADKFLSMHQELKKTGEFSMLHRKKYGKPKKVSAEKFTAFLKAYSAKILQYHRDQYNEIGACVAISYGVKKLMKKEGISCGIYQDVVSPAGFVHLYNIVNVDGIYYRMDFTTGQFEKKFQWGTQLDLVIMPVQVKGFYEQEAAVFGLTHYTPLEAGIKSEARFMHAMEQ
ncbi:hypothetical protein ACFL4F_01110 [Candidatus Margulisiibacteriota bacterium]